MKYSQERLRDATSSKTVAAAAHCSRFVHSRRSAYSKISFLYSTFNSPWAPPRRSRYLPLAVFDSTRSESVHRRTIADLVADLQAPAHCSISRQGSCINCLSVMAFGLKRKHEDGDTEFSFSHGLVTFLLF